MNIFTDSKGARDIINGNKPGQATKYLMTKYHSIRQLVDKRLINVQHISGDINVADGMTKCLGFPKFTKFLQMLKNGGVLKPRAAASANQSAGAVAGAGKVPA